MDTNTLKLENAAGAVDDAITALQAVGQSKKINSMVRKLITIKAELAGEVTRARVMSEIPAKKTKQE